MINIDDLNLLADEDESDKSFLNVLVDSINRLAEAVEVQNDLILNPKNKQHKDSDSKVISRNIKRIVKEMYPNIANHSGYVSWVSNRVLDFEEIRSLNTIDENKDLIKEYIVESMIELRKFLAEYTFKRSIEQDNKALLSMEVTK